MFYQKCLFSQLKFYLGLSPALNQIVNGKQVSHDHLDKSMIQQMSTEIVIYAIHFFKWWYFKNEHTMKVQVAYVPVILINYLEISVTTAGWGAGELCYMDLPK